MKNLITIVFAIMSSYAFAQDATQKFSFDIEITEFRSENGKIGIEIFNGKGEKIQGAYVLIENDIAQWTVKDLPKGKYAVRYYHDENNDSKFGTNFMGIPNEGFGYSNNAKAYFGEPDFKDWLFDLDENKSLNLNISYLF